MIDTSKVHPLFDAILAEHFFQQAPCEDINRNVPTVTRFTKNEEYLEHHESREDLGEQQYGRSRF